MTSTSLAPRVDPGGRTDPVRLLRSWTPGHASWFSGPRGSFLARGAAATLATTDPDAVAHALREHAARNGGPSIVVGALPYDTVGAAAHLVIPEHVDYAHPLGTVLVAETTGTAISGTPHPVPPLADYEAMVAEALARMSGSALEKVVLARTLDVIADGPIDPVPMLRELAHRDPRAYLFAVALPPGAAEGPRTLLGASPELLLRRDGRTVTANPLAGSAARATDPDEDRARGEALLASAKDRHEHALVVREVAAGLGELCTDLEVPEVPSLVRTATLWHLSTTIRGRVADRRTGALHLASALHPTPAVCGVPRAEAHAAIAEIEPFDRGFYTGMVGWTDVHGDGEWVVALRCGEVADDRVRLYAGAGIVPASVPSAELAETAVKLRTLLDALGLDEA